MVKPNMSDKIALSMTDAGIDLEQYGASAQRRMLAHLKKLENDLVRQIEAMDIGGATRMTTKQRRAENLLRKVRDTINTSYKEMAGSLKVDNRELAALQHETTVNLINKAVGMDITSVSLSPTELKVLSDRALVLGLPAQGHWAGQSERTRRAFASEIRTGYLAGETNDQLIQRIRGKATGKKITIELPNGKIRRVPEYANGVMQTTTNEARTLVRTSVQSVSNETILDTYKKNDDVIKGVEALATLDGKTTSICISRSGMAWDLDGNPIEESGAQYPFPGKPPWHFRCRSTIIPLLYSWEELIEKETGKKLEGLNELPKRTRASMDGTVSNVRTFDDWYKIKGDAFARKQLGPGRFNLWKEGKLSLTQLLDQSGRPLPLKSLRARFGQNYGPVKVTGKDSFARFRRKDGSWNPDRVKLHEKIIAEHLKGARAQKKPIYHMMGGGPAAGKSYAIKKGGVKLPNHHVFVDSDAIKAMLPEYAAGVKAGDGSIATFAHRESSYLSEQIMSRAAKKRFNVVLDGTGDGGVGKLKRRIDRFSAEGYRVNATYVTVDTATAVERNMIRYRETGRYVPNEYVRGVHGSISKVLPKATKNGYFDDLQLFDTNGPEIRLIMEYRNGRIIIHDEKAYRSFMAKSKDAFGAGTVRPPNYFSHKYWADLEAKRIAEK